MLQWDFTGSLLLIADTIGCVKIFKTKDHLLNDWQLLFQKLLEGEHVLTASFFHSGKKVFGFHCFIVVLILDILQVCLNSEKKDSSSYMEKFQHIKFSCSVKQFGNRPANGVLLLTTTGMLITILLPHPTYNVSMVLSREPLGAARNLIKTADICYGKSKYY